MHYQKKAFFSFLLPQPIRPRHAIILASPAGIVVFVAVVYWLVTGSWSQMPTNPNACTTFACREYAKRLHATVNRSVNPCESFTRFVCDGWRQSNGISVWEDQFREVFKKLNRTLRKVEWPSQGQSEEQRVAAVFQSCDDVLQGKSDQLPAVKIALADAGSIWPQRSESADVLYTLLYCSLKLGWDALLEFQVERSADGKLVLFVHPGKSLSALLALHEARRTNATKEAYFEFLHKQFNTAGNTNYANSVTYQDMAKYEEPAMTRIRGVPYETPGVHPVTDIVKNVTHINLTESRWVETMQRLNVSVSADSPYPLTTQLGYFKEIVSLWDEFGEDSFHLLVSWCTVQIAALYANRDLIFNYHYPYRQAVDVYHAAFCVGRAAYFSSHATFARYNREVLKGDAEAVAKNLVLSVRSAFFHRLSSWDHVDQGITIIANWSSLSTVFRSFEYGDATETAGSEPIPDMTGSFVDNWKHSVLVKSTLDTDNVLYALDNLETQVFLISERDVQLMPYALSYPLFDADLPAAVNYGGLGAEVGGAIPYVFLAAYGAVNAFLIEPFARCMSRGPFSDVTDVAAYAFAAGMFGPLVDAYKVNGYQFDVPLPGFEAYSGLQTLFISQCYILCQGSHRRNSKFVCDVYLQHVPEFAEAFNCRQGDPLYPVQQCKLF